MDIVEHEEFQKQLKKLNKKFDDFKRSYDNFQKVVKNDSLFNEVILRNSITIPNTNSSVIFYKYRKFKLANVKGNMIRIVFYIEDSIVYFVEIYSKNKQENHSIELIKKYSK